MSGDGSNGRGLNPRLLQALAALVIGAIAVGGLVVKGCQDGPFGRKQIVAISPQQEDALGVQAYDEVLQKSKVIRSGPVVKDVDRVTDRLIRATRNPEFLRMARLKERHFDWEVRVVRSNEVNAFCLPGGKMVVYTDILPVCQTDAGLATVMGHEISHALARHGAERMAQQQIAQIIVGAGSASLGDMSAQQRQRVLQVLNAGAQFGILKYSRRHESEADHMGLLLMATAGYNPEESVKFWERMARITSGGKRPPEFMSTHPSHETRIRDLIKWIPQAMPLYKASGNTAPPQKLHLE
jgi:predicted Zn-dependent protease